MDRRIRTFLSLPRSTKLLFLSSFLFLPLYQLCVTLLPFKLLCWLFRLRVADCDATQVMKVASQQRFPLPDRLKSVSYAITRPAQLHVFPCRCFAQALFARNVLKHFGEQPFLLLGATITTGTQNDAILSSHAWLCCRGYVVTGRDEVTGFTPLVCYT